MYIMYNIQDPAFTHQHYGLGFPGGSDSKESTCNAGDLGSIPGLGRSPGGGNSYSLQYSGLENSMEYIVPWGHKELDMNERLSLSMPPGVVPCCNSVSDS